MRIILSGKRLWIEKIGWFLEKKIADEFRRQSFFLPISPPEKSHPSPLHPRPTMIN